MAGKMGSEADWFTQLPAEGRRWAVGAIHSDVDKLRALHGELRRRLGPDDGVVYLGNYTGYGREAIETLNELLMFRRWIMARPGAQCRDVVFLRGMQEEMWHKLLQIQIAPDPRGILMWMLDRGIGPTIQAYGSTVSEGLSRAESGHLALAQWTSRLRDALRRHDGHNALMSALRRAAYTADGDMLFVNAGIDPDRPLSAQTDSFWWGARGFDSLTTPYEGFARLVRGFDPRNKGVLYGDHKASIDGGCGRDGKLMAVCFASAHQIVDEIEA
ncbi:hypothetical protein JCM17960_12010 [Magnetospira thiophila]